jgi:hypothetical protein
MIKTIVNLTQRFVTQEIERLFKLCPNYPHQQIFAQPEKQQALLVWVLNRVQNVFALTDDVSNITYLPQSIDERSNIEYIIWQGIQAILAEEMLTEEMLTEEMLTTATVPKLEVEKAVELTVCNWFG